MRPARSTSRLLFSSSLLIALIAPLAAAAQAGTGPAGAGQAPPPDETGGGPLAEVVVTADRFPTAADQVGASVTVLTAADIKADQEIGVAEILTRTPGVAFARNGGPGGTTSLFIRGAESAQTVVLVDGV